MCKLFYPSKDEVISGQGKLAEYLGGEENVKFYSEDGTVETNTCLCGVDLERTAQENGFDVRKDYCGDYIEI